MCALRRSRSADIPAGANPKRNEYTLTSCIPLITLLMRMFVCAYTSHGSCSTVTVGRPIPTLFSLPSAPCHRCLCPMPSPCVMWDTLRERISLSLSLALPPSLSLSLPLSMSLPLLHPNISGFKLMGAFPSGRHRSTRSPQSVSPVRVS